MRTTELALIAAIVLGCIFKIQHWPGAGALFVLGSGALGLFYFPFGFRTLPAPKPTDQILWMTILGGACLSSAMFGFLFFMQHWPHSALLLLIGSLLCAAALLIGLVVRSRHRRLDIYFDGLLIRCLVLGGLAFTLWGLFTGKPR